MEGLPIFLKTKEQYQVKHTCCRMLDVKPGQMQVLSLGLPTAVVGDEASKCLLTY